MADIADKLDEARALIEKGWTQGEYAIGKSGRAVDERGRHAICFCSIGAARRIDYWNADMILRPLIRAVGVKYVPDLIEWNDAPERTQAEVIEAFKKAAELARAEA